MRSPIFFALAASAFLAVIGGLFYSDSFGYTDGEYVVAYFLTPIIQAPSALIALAVALWRRKLAGIMPSDISR